MKAYYGCEHQVMEYNSCCHNQRKFFYVDDLINHIQKRMEELTGEAISKDIGTMEASIQIGRIAELMNMLKKLTNTEDK